MTKLQDEIKSGKLQLLLDHNSVQNRIRGLAKEIIHFYEWEKNELVIVSLADGANIFTSDLVRLLPFKLKLYFLKVSTYEGTNKITKSVLNIDGLIGIENRNVLIVDDICDTSETLNSVIETIKTLKPKTIKTVVLLNKNVKKEFDIKLDFCGFNISNVFVVGFGLDHNNYYRNLVDICILNTG